ncbi:SusE domain-containing protein [Mucilaginibacter sp.]
MKKLINFTLIALVTIAVACHKDATVTKLQPVKFDSNVTASTNAIILSSTSDSTSVLTLNWTAATYPIKLKVTYTVQIDAVTDTGTWANAKTAVVGADILTKTFKGADINTWALALGIPGNTTGQLVFRIQAYQDRNAYSKPITITVTPYVSIFVAPPPPDSLGYSVLYLPGDYQGWSPGTAGTVAAPAVGVYKTSGIYEGYIYEPAGGTYHFKFTSAPDWNHINYGDGSNGALSTDGQAGDLVLPGPGFYELSADVVNLKWTATPTTWAIIGDATPNGWNTETEMTYVPAKHVWTITLNLIKSGSFKFRANNGWNNDFGIDPVTNRIFYADNPIFGGGGAKGGLNNLSVSEDGNYTVYLDLSNPNRYYYYLQKH